MSGLNLLSGAVARVSGKTFSRKFITLGRILSYWNDIMGEEMAERAQPVKIHYRGKSPKGDTRAKPEATLEIAVSSADAVTLHYRKDLILERINQVFGERWVTALRFVHVPANTMPAYSRASKTLTENEKKYLSTMLESVTDDEIRERLQRLGAAVIQDTQRQAPGS